MKFSKGKINNINKKLLVGTIAFTLLTIPLSSCSGTKLEYEMNDKGQMVCIENIKYRYLQKYKVLVLGEGENQYFYIVRLEHKNSRITNEFGNKYYDIFGDNLVYNDNIESSFKMITVLDLNNYLVSYNLIQEEYSEQDIKGILEIIESDYNKKTEKQLIK